MGVCALLKPFPLQIIPSCYSSTAPSSLSNFLLELISCLCVLSHPQRCRFLWAGNKHMWHQAYKYA